MRFARSVHARAAARSASGAGPSAQKTRPTVSTRDMPVPTRQCPDCNRVNRGTFLTPKMLAMALGPAGDLWRVGMRFVAPFGHVVVLEASMAALYRGGDSGSDMRTKISPVLTSCVNMPGLDIV